jgi:hypothetical protein
MHEIHIGHSCEFYCPRFCITCFTVYCVDKRASITCMRLVVESLANAEDGAMPHPERSLAACSS